jgi:hypothetical protein
LITPSTITISKSKFMAGVQCLKRLYLLVHEPQLGSGKTAADFAIMEQGRQVGRLAQQLFPGGVLVRSGDPEEAIRTTRELIANREAPAIFEAAFEDGGVFVRVDVLQRRRDKRWRLIEVKSTADLKEHHLDDVAIQYRVLSRSGLDVASCSLAHVNRSYVFPGGSIDPPKFFHVRNLTRRVERLQPKLTFQLRSELRVLAMSSAPEIPTGPHCTNPVTCEFYDYCNPVRQNDHVSRIPRIHASAVEDDIQPRAATSVQTGQPWFSPELAAKLEKLEYPVYFLDFETVNPAIPRFAGMHPYDHLPFQWSLHIQRELGAEPEHHEFLAEDRSDPRREFIAALCDALGECGGIVVYNQHFESSRLSELAEWLPEYAERINGIQARLYDLLPIIRNHVYHPAFAGSYSLKSVLPALVPQMSYEGMAVADGVDAGLAWESLIRGIGDQAERERLRKALLDYCRQDTLALVKVLRQLKLESTSFGN